MSMYYMLGMQMKENNLCGLVQPAIFHCWHGEKIRLNGWGLFLAVGCGQRGPRG